ncbi:gluconate transporter (plasmid) [Gemmatirosa kalamazoonensis]|uniref:Gluconate transporter n=1 Tax=Gemmatirosa kalamazoonensis TaxID=861299 RepID=W0RQJ5_9BACT|nr:gluconate:H+ symporter [Gemmatirosa kalamazoonensis]AHG92722.1 gluconate transporter [Gemmatirosa kalamazoonensis]
MVQGNLLLAYAAASIVALVLLIARLKLNPFVALVVVSLALGVAVGMPMGNIVKAFETGAGGALGHIAIVIALGTMLGKMMAESGGAERIAHTVIDAFGERNVHWAMGCIAFLVGIPVFFDVGFVLLVPIAFNVARRTGASMVLVGLPMVAGLSVVHGLVPPHPAALIAVQAYHADIGRTMLYALVVGLPTMALAGPLFARLMAPRVVPAGNPMLQAELTEEAPAAQRALPGFGVTVATILLPVALMLVGNWADALAPAGSVPNDLLRLAGTPVAALLIALLVSFVTLGRAFSREAILRFTNECLGPIAGVTLVIGAGAGFGRILMDGGVSAAVVDLATRASVPPLLLGWLVAALIRVATGSATVAMTTACGIVAPIAAQRVSPELMVLATGAGSLILSHVNDGGFWLVKEYFGLTVPQTLATWTVCETVISVVALGLTMALAAVV